MKERYVGETLGEDIIVEVRFEDLKSNVLVELLRYIINSVLVESSRKVTVNSCAVNFIKVHAIYIRQLYRVKEIDRGHNLEMARRERKKALKSKSKIPRAFKSKMPINECNKVQKDWEKFGYKIPKMFNEALLLH